MGRPWVAWLGNSTAGLPALILVGPDGSSYAPWAGTAGNAFSFWYRPIVLAGGLGGSGAFPALGVQQTEGLHVITPDTDTAVWTDHVVPGSQQVVYTGDCPPSGTVTTGAPCKGLTSCTQHGVGALSGFGLVRTASGRAYAGRLETDSTITYALTQSAPTCTSGGMPCMCQASATSLTRTSRAGWSQAPPTLADQSAQLHASSPRLARRPTSAASPASSQPARSSSSSRPSAPLLGRGLPTEHTLSARLQLEGRGFILASRSALQVWPSPWLRPSPLALTRPA
jgi:hypothetical protein